MLKKITKPLSILLLGYAFNVHALASQNNVDERVETLLAKMTLEEKIGQMNLYNGFWDLTGPAPEEGDAKAKYAHLAKGWVGATYNVIGVENATKMQKIAVEESRLGIPLLFALDVVHGHKTVFPIPLAEAASWDLQAIEQSARTSAIEATSRGINWTFAPMVDISYDARWGRVMEGAGEDVYLSNQIAVARVKGYQGDDLSAANTLAATVKHFAGYGFSEAGRDYNISVIDKPRLHNVVLPPFKAAVDAGVQSVMNSFNTLDGIPATASSYLQRDILKDLWGFKGLVVSDWASGAEMINYGYASDLKEVALQSVQAGSDMDMESYAYIKHLAELVRTEKVDVALIDDAVRRILAVKFKLGLFDDPYRYLDPEREEKWLNHPTHHAQALEMAKKSFVLLKNENDLLPLQKDQEKVLVIGDLADDKNSILGNWRSGSDDHSAVSLLEGLQAYEQPWQFEQGPALVKEEKSFLYAVDINHDDKSGFESAVEAARDAQVVVMMLGEHGMQSGEGRSRANIGLPGQQQALLEAVHQVNKNIVLVVPTGRPLDLSWAAENIPSILIVWQPGSQGGNAIAQTLFGDFNPQGRLPMSFPRSVAQVPVYYSRYATGRPGPLDTIFWSHYNDIENTPLYSFGYGLSYSGIDYSQARLEAHNTHAVVSVTVQNQSDREAVETVQLYIRDKVASVIRPIKELRQFKQIKLGAGQTQTVRFEIHQKQLGFYDNQGHYLVEPGDFDVMVGPNSQQLQTMSFKLEETGHFSHE